MKFFSIFVILFIGTILIGCQQDERPGDELSQSNRSMKDKEQIEINEAEETNPDSDQNPEEGNENSKEEENQNKESENNSNQNDEAVNEDANNSGLTVVDNPNSIEVFVNKQRKLPDGWNPSNLVVPNVPFYFDEYLPKKQMKQVAANALEELFNAAESEGLNLVAASGYRSYDRQKVIYENNVATNGKEHADKFSAQPGTSEHQTGLAMDVTTAEVAFALEQTFKQTSEGSWLAENAHKFGFIIRYPEGKSDITGYSYEPWHIRYVGNEIAKEIYEKGITLEEYFGYGY
ncbi:M15 family metallopeptidase [Aquibacillus rhizosphaerae]|uniref:M15 family metallopeptidase n=1 Tax=Aquibacillus rhizosphaerae TaxID=3051431 RepID=A0ABT7LA35_9BACI|nr:M15 family metallopeptidase [Aquibacillus sp. LR5S19]MDL4842728.1 M15 family metallopeptidase [Aquibacillus sp. LR5S19]